MTEPSDPIWAAIEKHRNERAAYHKEGEKYRDTDLPDDAEDAMLAAGRQLFITRPTTVAGAIAVLRYVRSQEDKSDSYDGASPTYMPDNIDGVFWAHAFFESIADALSSAMNSIVAVTGGVVPASPSIESAEG
jgi:hypothetical protein